MRNGDGGHLVKGGNDNTMDQQCTTCKVMVRGVDTSP